MTIGSLVGLLPKLNAEGDFQECQLYNGLVTFIIAGSFGEHSASNAQEKQNLAEAITISQTPQHSHSAGFEVDLIVSLLSSFLHHSLCLRMIEQRSSLSATEHASFLRISILVLFLDLQESASGFNSYCTAALPNNLLLPALSDLG